VPRWKLSGRKLLADPCHDFMRRGRSVPGRELPVRELLADPRRRLTLAGTPGLFHPASPGTLSERLRAGRSRNRIGVMEGDTAPV